MQENERIKKLYNDLYNGEPWIDVNLVSTLEAITTQEAFTRISGLNTIAEIAKHMVEWRFNVLKRIKGEVITTPAHNYFEKITGVPEQSWIDIRHRLKESQQSWIGILENFQAS